MTRETAHQISEKIKKRLKLNRLLQEAQDLDTACRIRREALRFETAKVEQEALKGKRDTTVSWLTPCECELISEIRQLSKALREKEGRICDLVVELGLKGVDL